jgi:SNF2 family DNA or RNA helicase
MLNVIQEGSVYNITFKYDPQLIFLVKNVPGRRWEPSTKTWSIPSENLGIFLNEIKGTVYEDIANIKSTEDLNVNQTIDATQSIPDIDISHWDYLVKEDAKPFAHQLDFMKFAINRFYNQKNRNGFLLTDEQGLAKTSEVMNWALYQRKHQKYKHCLIIVCINGAKYNWVEDIKLHTQGKEIPYILGTRIKRDGKFNFDAGSKAKLEDLQSGYCYGKTDMKLPYFIVMNIEAIRMKSARKMPILEEIIKLCNDGKINMIAIDEIHLNMSPSSLQGKAILKAKKQVQSQVEWIPTTGTPIINRPTDVFSPLRLVNGHTFKDFWTWCQHFVVYGGFGGHDVLGYKNIPQLKIMLQSNMIRRLKKDVLDLPPKIYYTEYVENTSYQSALYKKVQAMVKEQKAEILQRMNPLVALLRLRQVNGAPELVDEELTVDSSYFKKNAKMHRIIELIEEIHEREEKVIIYSNWVEPLRTLHNFISKKYKVCVYTGTMKSADREQHKQTFINNPEHTIMIGTIDALGVSHTLTVARNIIFLDEPWTPSGKEQAEDRAHRPGTTDTVNIYTVITKDTIDEVVHNILLDKKLMANYIVDDTLNLRHNSELFDKLLA